MMWMWRSLLCVSLVWGLALDSNTIRSSKEMQHSPEQLDHSHGEQAEPAARRQTEMNSNRRAEAPCTTPDCFDPPTGGCSNRAQKRLSSQDRQVDTETDADSFKRTKAPEMSICVRTRDCADGLCCARYLNEKRCLRVPGEGEACLLQGATKRQRNLERCRCGKGLTCTAVSKSGRNQGHGVCRRLSRQPGKKRRTAEGSC